MRPEIKSKEVTKPNVNACMRFQEELQTFPLSEVLSSYRLLLVDLFPIRINHSSQQNTLSSRDGYPRREINTR